MRRFVILLAVILALAALAAPASAIPDPCILNCHDIGQTSNTTIQ